MSFIFPTGLRVNGTFIFGYDPTTQSLPTAGLYCVGRMSVLYNYSGPAYREDSVIQSLTEPTSEELEIIVFYWYFGVDVVYNYCTAVTSSQGSITTISPIVSPSTSMVMSSVSSSHVIMPSPPSVSPEMSSSFQEPVSSMMLLPSSSPMTQDVSSSIMMATSSPVPVAQSSSSVGVSSIVTTTRALSYIQMSSSLQLQQFFLSRLYDFCSQCVA